MVTDVILYLFLIFFCWLLLSTVYARWEKEKKPKGNVQSGVCLWTGSGSNELYLTSGQFTSCIKTSELLIPEKEQTCIIVRILIVGGTHHYPKFNEIPLAIRGWMDWFKFIDNFGSGWRYGPIRKNTRYGAMKVPKTFAEEALAKFPDDVKPLSEEDWQLFKLIDKARRSKC